MFSKATVEELVRAGGFPAYTIVRPAVLHHDLFLPGLLQNFPRLSTLGELDDLLVGGARVPHTDTDDVGKYAAAALLDSAEFGGEESNLGHELLTMEEIRDILVKISSRRVSVTKWTPQEVEERGIAVFGQKFQLLSNIKDLSWTSSEVIVQPSSSPSLFLRSRLLSGVKSLDCETLHDGGNEISHLIWTVQWHVVCRPCSIPSRVAPSLAPDLQSRNEAPGHPVSFTSVVSSPAHFF